MALTMTELQFNHRRTKKGTISNKRQSCKKNATAKGLEFSLTTPYLSEVWDSNGGCCALCGGELGFIGSGWSAASVDRINPNIGYIEGNVQWTHWRCNDAKSNMNNEDFLTMCAAIAAKHFARI